MLSSVHFPLVSSLFTPTRALILNIRSLNFFLSRQSSVCNFKFVNFSHLFYVPSLVFHVSNIFSKFLFSFWRDSFGSDARRISAVLFSLSYIYFISALAVDSSQYSSFDFEDALQVGQVFCFYSVQDYRPTPVVIPF